MMAAMPELKPCPFCGGKAKINQVSLCFFNVFCADRTCIGFTTTGTYPTAQEAAEAWNRRVNAAKTQRGEWINGCECRWFDGESNRLKWVEKSKEPKEN